MYLRLIVVAVLEPPTHVAYPPAALSAHTKANQYLTSSRPISSKSSKIILAKVIMSQDNLKRTSRAIDRINYLELLNFGQLDSALEEYQPPPLKSIPAPTMPELVISSENPPVRPISGTSQPPESMRRSARLVESASLNRVSDPYGEFYQVKEDQLPGSLEPQFLGDRVDCAHFTLRRLGFTLVWDLVLPIGRGHGSSSTEAETEQFFTSTRTSELFDLLEPFLPSDSICNASKSLYLLEWEHV